MSLPVCLRNKLLLALVGMALSAGVPCASATELSREAVAALALSDEQQIDTLREYGPAVMPVLVELYEQGNENQRATLAGVFYQLGWKSQEAAQALMRDVHTQNRSLRLQVQWALGRVSDAPEVVDVLLQNMRYDDNPLFRDKAACALAYDQIHLNPQQKLRLYEGLVASLSSDKRDVRQIALLALRIQTGQDKGFRADAPEAERNAKIAEWQQWLEEYRTAL